MLIQETYFNKTEKHMISESDLYTPFTDDISALFKALQKEHGRCISRVYSDDKDGVPHHVGWIFQKKRKYEDTDEYYLQEVWVTLYEKKPEAKITQFPLYLEEKK